MGLFGNSLRRASITQILIRPEILAAHKAAWYVWAGGQKMRRTSKMMGSWGYDVTCSCGWESKTGGATRRSVERDLLNHRLDEQVKADLAREALTVACTDCGARAGARCTSRGWILDNSSKGEPLETPHFTRMRDAMLKSMEESRS